MDYSRNIILSILLFICCAWNVNAFGEAPLLTEIIDIDTALLVTEDCESGAGLCLDIALPDMVNYEITDNGVLYTGESLGCDYDTLTTYGYTTLFGLGETGPYFLDSWMINGEIYTGDFDDIPALVDSMNLWDPNGNWIHNPDAFLITGGTPGNQYSDMFATQPVVNASSTIGLNYQITPNGTSLFFEVGEHEVIISERVGDCKDTVLVYVACLTTETIEMVGSVGDIDTLCIDFTELLGAPVETIDFCPEQWGETAAFSMMFNDACIEVESLAPGIDTMCILVCDDLGFCDTSYYILTVPTLGQVYEVYDTVFVGETFEYCLDTTNLMGNIMNTLNVCPGNFGTYADFNIDIASSCVSYEGLNVGGTDQVCIVLCDNFNTCDTTNIYVDVVPALSSNTSWVYDTVFVNQGDQFCPDQTDLNGTVTDFEDACAALNGEYVSFDLDNSIFCVDYNGFDIGKDTACLVLTDDLGNTDTTYFVVCVVPPNPDIILDTIMLGTNGEYCLSDDELGGIVNNFVECEEFSSNAVNFVINNVDLCVTANSLAVGTDTFCVVMCDNLSVCDTTSIFVTVVPPDSSSPPVASNDSYNTSQNDNLVVHYCENDVIPGNNLTNGYILPSELGGVGPNFGVALNIDECTLEYMPDENCPYVDSFTYVICNEMGCDTANIVVNVECQNQDFQIYNGFSPNGDDVNDVFRIDGIENLTDHNLCIYNRWGNQVLQTNDYKNDWRGTFEGKDLPDGTYFYVLDDGLGEVHTGYVVIFR